MNGVDPEINAILGSIFSEALVVEDEPSDPFAKFITDAQLAGAGTGWSGVEALRKETSNIERRADATIKAGRQPQPSIWETEVTADDELAKDADANPAKDKKYAWIRSRMNRLAKSANEVVNDWCQEYPTHDPAIAADLRRVARQLDGA